VILGRDLYNAEVDTLGRDVRTSALPVIGVVGLDLYSLPLRVLCPLGRDLYSVDLL
jgi:hypothetical protein